MLKSFLFHTTPLLKKLRTITFFLAFVLIVLYVISIEIASASDPQFDSQKYLDIYGPFIIGTIVFSVICELLIMMIKSGPVKIEAAIIVEGIKLSEKQSMAVRMALKNYCEDFQLKGDNQEYRTSGGYDVKQAIDVLKMINHG
ncbi:hypothetical protein [Pseudomonas sp. DC3000-4b1]|uniref:hypothetical protein n=1 Tax=unclassified Pseudomonas TaxID=196821 RepID=UPI003CFB7D29